MQLEPDAAGMMLFEPRPLLECPPLYESGDSWGVYWALRAINQGLFHALIIALITDSLL